MEFFRQGVRIVYETHGSRMFPAVMFVHGFPFRKEMWRPQIDALREDHFVITYDIRGHGASDVGDGQYTLEEFVDDLTALLDHLRIASAVLVGLSMGGYIALRAVERHPERCRALVLCDTRSEADGNDAKIRRAAQVAIAKSGDIRAFIEPFIAAVLSEHTVLHRPDVVAEVRSFVESTSPRAIAGTLIALAARTDTSPSLYGIKVPTLILVGQHDTLTPPSAAHAMKGKIPHADIHIIPDAGHVSNLENPGVFNAHLRAFLGNMIRRS